MPNNASHQLPLVECVGAGFDPSPLPHRALQWRRAARAMLRIHAGYDDQAALDYAAALEGDDGERDFQGFLLVKGIQGEEKGAFAGIGLRFRLRQCGVSFQNARQYFDFAHRRLRRSRHDH